MQSPTLTFFVYSFRSFVNDHRVEKRSIETTSWFASRPEFRFKTFFSSGFFIQKYMYTYVTGVYVALYSYALFRGIQGILFWYLSAKIASDALFIIFSFLTWLSFSDSLLHFIYLFISNGVRHPVCIYELVYTYKFP